MRRNTFEPISTPLETKFNTPFLVVGTQEWLDTAFEPNALSDSEKVVISDREQLKPIIAQARSLPVIGVDTETTGPYIPGNKSYSMNPINEGCRIVLLQIGNEDLVWLIEPAFIGEFKDVLENTDQLHLAHNWAYDFKWLLVKYKIHPLRLYCSMLAEQLLTAGMLGIKVGLSDCASEYEPYNLVSKAVRSMFIHLDGGKITRNMVKYAVRDIPLLFPVYRGQLKELIREDPDSTSKDPACRSFKKVAQLEFDNIPVAVEMETGGILLDQVKLKQMILYWRRRQAAVEKKILNLYTKRVKGARKVSILPEEWWREVFNLKSNKDKLEAINNILDTDLKDVKRATLLAANDELTGLLADYSNILKNTSTYGKNILDKINKKTGLLYPRFAQMGFGSAGEDGRNNKETTATGRWVGDVQQFPRKSDGRYSRMCDPIEEAAVLDYFADAISEIKAKYKE